MASERGVTAAAKRGIRQRVWQDRQTRSITTNAWRYYDVVGEWQANGDGEGVNGRRLAEAWSGGVSVGGVVVAITWTTYQRGMCAAAAYQQQHRWHQQRAWREISIATWHRDIANGVAKKISGNGNGRESNEKAKWRRPAKMKIMVAWRSRAAPRAIMASAASAK